MKLIKAAQLTGLILLAAMAGSVIAQRHGGRSGGSHYSGHYSGHYHSGSHVGVGVYFGSPAFWYYPSPYYYYPPAYYSPYYYYPPAAALPYAPPAYVEQEAAPAEPSQSNWWYYCAGSNSYYPYVQECPGGWQRISPQPPPPG